MGTTKRLVLASVVSMMLVLAFMIGFVPSHDAGLTGAAGSDGRVDMAGLLDMILGDKAFTAITPNSKFNGNTIWSVDDNATVPYVPMPVTATANGAADAGDTVYHVLTNGDDPLQGFQTNGVTAEAYWTGPATQYRAGGGVAPFNASWDMGTLMPVAGTVAYALDSLVVAAAGYGVYFNSPSGPYDGIYFSLSSNPGATANVTLSTVPGAAADADNNAILDPLANLPTWTIWVANKNIRGNASLNRVVVAANIYENDTKALGDVLTYNPRPDVAVGIPSYETFSNAGLVSAGEQLIAVIAVADSLAGVIDTADGSNVDANINTWATAAIAGAPGTPVPGAPVVDVDFIVTDGAGTQLRQLDTLNGLTVQVSISGLTGLNASRDISIWGVPTAFDNTVGYTLTASGAPADQWHVGDASPAVDTVSGTIVADIDNFSAFVPLYSSVRVDSVDPLLIPADIAIPMTLTGVFPTWTAANPANGLTVAEATAAYTVTIGGVPATFRSGVTPGDVAVTPLDTTAPFTPNTMYITSPVIPGIKAQFVNVVVTLNGVPGASSTLTATLEAEGTGQVTLTTSGTGTGTVTLTPPNGSLTLSDSTVINFPAGRYFVGSPLTATATPTGTSVFVGWSQDGTTVGNTPSLNLTVAGDTTIDGQFDLPALRYSLTLLPATGGAVTLNPAQPAGGYVPGTLVTLTAVANPTFLFNRWLGANVGNLAPNTLAPVVTLLMNGDKTVGAEFLADTGTIYRLTLTAGAGGAASVAPLGINGGSLYNGGTSVVITATPIANYLFNGWTGSSAASLADTTNPVQAVTMNSDKNFVANFRQALNITSITPNNAWIFGGVVAKITGTGLSVATKFVIGGQDVWGFNPAADGSSIEVVIPATADRTDNALVITTVVASLGTATTPALPFTYKRYAEDLATGANTTAFILDSPNSENTVKLDTGAGDITSGSLIIPGLNTSAAKVFGIVIDQQLVVAAAKATTEAIPSGSTAAAMIEDADAGDAVANAYDFSIYLYTEDVGKQTTPTAESQIPVYADASAALQVALGPGEDASGIPNAGTAMKVTLPLGDTDLTYADVRNGLAIWGIEGQYNYVANIESVTTPNVEAYQSELLQNEVDPNMTDTTLGTAAPDQMLKARVYSLNGFSLRKGWSLPAAIADEVRLAEVDGVAVAGTGSGPVAGGTVLTLVSPGGGLGYVDRVELRAPAKLGGKLGGTATETLFVSKPGADEYTFEFKTPKSGKAGVCDVAVYLKSDPTNAALVLSKSFEYKGKPCNVTPFLLIPLGLLLGLLGILAGTDTGGGGGGPCFIATAAYGTPMAADIDTLRTVRDTFMLDNTVGSAMVDAYYRVSPAIADAVAQSPVLAALIRLLLVPVIFAGKIALMMPVPALMMLAAFGVAFMLRRRAGNRA